MFDGIKRIDCISTNSSNAYVVVKILKAYCCSQIFLDPIERRIVLYYVKTRIWLKIIVKHYCGSGWRWIKNIVAHLAKDEWKIKNTCCLSKTLVAYQKHLFLIKNTCLSQIYKVETKLQRLWFYRFKTTPKSPSIKKQKPKRGTIIKERHSHHLRGRACSRGRPGGAGEGDETDQPGCWGGVGGRSSQDAGEGVANEMRRSHAPLNIFTIEKPLAVHSYSSPVVL